MNAFRIGMAALGMLTFGISPAHAAGDNASPRGYAEELYAEFAAGTGHRVSFEVRPLGAGALSQIADMPFGELVASTDYMLSSDEFGTEIRNPGFVAAYNTDGYDVFMAAELKNTPRGFETQAGYPVKTGTYRKLGISTTIGSETRQHEALEFCWASLKHCTVVDPTVVFMESTVQNRLRLKAEGWGPKQQEVDTSAAETSSGEIGASAVCRLASNTTLVGRSLTWSARTVEYKNVFGNVLVRKSLAGQQAGLRCDAYCKPAPYGYSYVSSCNSFLGWSCDCANKFASGITGGTGKFIAETKCAHKYAFSADASVSVSGVGSASVGLNWTMDGSSDGTGGYYTDTCGWF